MNTSSPGMEDAKKKYFDDAIMIYSSTTQNFKELIEQFVRNTQREDITTENLIKYIRHNSKGKFSEFIDYLETYYKRVKSGQYDASSIVALYISQNRDHARGGSRKSKKARHSRKARKTHRSRR